MDNLKDNLNQAALNANLTLLSGSNLDAARRIDRVYFRSQICRNAFSWGAPRDNWWNPQRIDYVSEKINKIYGDPFKAIFVSSDNDVDKKFEMLKIFSDLIIPVEYWPHIQPVSLLYKLCIYREAIKYLSDAETKDAKQLIEKIGNECYQIREHLCGSAFEALGGDSERAFTYPLYQLNTLLHYIPTHNVYAVVFHGGAYADDPNDTYGWTSRTPGDYHKGDSKEIFLSWVSTKGLNVLDKIFGDGSKDVTVYISRMKKYSDAMNLTLVEYVQLVQNAIEYVSRKPELKGFALPLSDELSKNTKLRENLNKLYRLIELIEWLCDKGAIRIEGYPVVGSAVKASAAHSSGSTGEIKSMDIALSHNALNELADLVKGLNYADMLQIKSKVGSNNAEDTGWEPFESTELDTMIMLSSKMDAVSKLLNKKFEDPKMGTKAGRVVSNILNSFGNRVGPGTNELEEKWKALKKADYLLYASDRENVGKDFEQPDKTSLSEQQYQKLCRLVDLIDWLRTNGAITLDEVNNNQAVASKNINTDQGDTCVKCLPPTECKVDLSNALRASLDGLNYKELCDLKANYVGLEAHSNTLARIDKLTHELDLLSQPSKFTRSWSSSPLTTQWTAICTNDYKPPSFGVSAELVGQGSGPTNGKK